MLKCIYRLSTLFYWFHNISVITEMKSLKKTKPNSYMTKTNKKVANSVFYFFLFGISITNLRKMFFILSQAWDKEKILSPHEELNLRLSDLHSNALLLSHRDSKVSEVYYEVHMAHILHTASISNVNSVMFVDRNSRDDKF